MPDARVRLLVKRAVVKRELVIRLPFAFCTILLGILRVVKAGPPIMVWATVNELTETAGVKIIFANTWPVEIVFAFRDEV